MKQHYETQTFGVFKQASHVVGGQLSSVHVHRFQGGLDDEEPWKLFTTQAEGASLPLTPPSPPNGGAVILCQVHLSSRGDFSREVAKIFRNSSKALL